MLNGIATPARLAIAATWLWLALWLSLGDGPPFFGYINALGFFWGLAAGIAALDLALQRSTIWAATGAAAAALALCHGQWPVLAAADTAPSSAQPLRVVTASFRTYNRDMASAAQLLAGYRPDILVAQEVSDVPAFLTRLEQESGRRWQAARRGNEIVASPWPIRDTLPNRAFLRATVATPDGPVTVWNVHAVKSYANAIAIRLQIAALTEDVAAHCGPRIVAGDFNATPWNDSYRTLSERLTDAFRVAGSGPGFTFPTRARRIGFAFPYLRIDHIFVDAMLQPVAAWTGDASPGADHRPVIADLVRSPNLRQAAR
ncbi:endonuclease/exonuclease/phosphatase family protein [Flavisphingomonas formosensis]|uniref:endonuclease/exonuclease/phosphatase family protein n=1 Tax=Flavisphingomonas formosensis TaxID=861534 RepID=UPI0012F823DD|nr:endonuclease/exonuclease/phosphatase family protein [Sphingomonas formosensis]